MEYDSKRVKDLAHNHWKWMLSVFHSLNNIDEAISLETAEVLYLTAFEHGYKHCHEDTTQYWENYKNAIQK